MSFLNYTVFFYRTATKLKQKYLYYIFCDGDIKLYKSNFKYQKRTTEEFKQMKEYSNNNYQIFEHFLIKFKPAIGSVENQYYHYQLIQIQSKIDVRRHCMSFDAQFNAYHYSILDDMLPYDNRNQNRSYWTSQILQQCKVFFRYHGYVYSLMSIYGSNNVHSQYPRAILRTLKKNFF